MPDYRTIEARLLNQLSYNTFIEHTLYCNAFKVASTNRDRMYTFVPELRTRLRTNLVPLHMSSPCHNP